ncbi:MAG: class II glutamine amidotransferase, partial [Myxococcota bacterium]
QSERHPDGWGVAYYMDRFPHVIRNTKKALDDRLFSAVSAVVQTRTLIAHIRQATIGQVGILNCHPFQFGPWTFAHNGNVEGFGDDPVTTEAVRALVDPRFEPYILGATDSETCFYIFLSRLARRVDDVYHEGIPRTAVLEALHEMVQEVVAIADPRAKNPDDPCKMTFVLTNGSSLVGYRHRKELFFSTHKERCPERDSCHAFEAGRCESRVDDGLVKHLVVTSERIAEGPNEVSPRVRQEVESVVEELELVIHLNRVVEGLVRPVAQRKGLPEAALVGAQMNRETTVLEQRLVHQRLGTSSPPFSTARFRAGRCSKRATKLSRFFISPAGRSPRATSARTG